MGCSSPSPPIPIPCRVSGCEGPVCCPSNLFEGQGGGVQPLLFPAVPTPSCKDNQCLRVSLCVDQSLRGDGFVGIGRIWTLFHFPSPPPNRPQGCLDREWCPSPSLLTVLGPRGGPTGTQRGAQPSRFFDPPMAILPPPRGGCHLPESRGGEEVVRDF